MLKKSVTVDEFTQLPAGYSYLKTRNFHLSNTNPPLIKILAAIPLYMKNIQFIKTESFKKGNQWMYGYEFMYNHRDIYREMFIYARLVIILIGLFGGLLVFLWARALYGYSAGLFALFLYSLSPNILAHIRFVTTDIGASVFMLASLYFFYRWMIHKSWKRSVIAGIFLGLAQLTKFTAILLYLPILISFLFSCVRNRFKDAHLSKFITIILISILVINVGYLFKGSFTQLQDFDFKSDLMMKFKESLPGSFRIFLPYDYVAGFDRQKMDTESKYRQFLMGEFSRHGWWYYYIVAFFLKTPVAFIFTILFLIIFQIFKKLPTLSNADEFILLFVFLYVLIFSLWIRHNIGFRFMLPVLPVLYIYSSRVVLVDIRKTIKIAILTLLLSSYAAETFAIHPHYLSFFNFLAGGPEKGHRYLIDSNIDWGQDLPYLKEYMDKHALQFIDLAYFGRVDPSIYGIKYRVLTEEAKSGVAAVSINYYEGLPYPILNGERLYRRRKDYYKYLHQYPITDRAGYSILIFDLGKAIE